MHKTLPAIFTGIALLSLASASAEAAQKRQAPVVKASTGACKPSDSGRVYRNYRDCVDTNVKLSYGSGGLSRYCSRFCSQ